LRELRVKDEKGEVAGEGRGGGLAKGGVIKFRKGARIKGKSISLSERWGGCGKRPERRFVGHGLSTRKTNTGGSLEGGATSGQDPLCQKKKTHHIKNCRELLISI